MTFLSTSKNHQPLARGAVKLMLVLKTEKDVLQQKERSRGEGEAGGGGARRAGAFDRRSRGPTVSATELLHVAQAGWLLPTLDLRGLHVKVGTKMTVASAKMSWIQCGGAGDGRGGLRLRPAGFLAEALAGPSCYQTWRVALPTGTRVALG